MEDGEENIHADIVAEILLFPTCNLNASSLKWSLIKALTVRKTVQQYYRKNSQFVIKTHLLSVPFSFFHGSRSLRNVSATKNAVNNKLLLTILVHILHYGSQKHLLSSVFSA